MIAKSDIYEKYICVKKLPETNLLETCQANKQVCAIVFFTMYTNTGSNSTVHTEKQYDLEMLLDTVVRYSPS